MNIFGTDGVRGLANTEPMTAETVLKLGKALVYYLKNVLSIDSPKILIGKDTRLSGYMFEQALSAGITSMGADVFLVGPLPTPAISYLTTDMRADAGIVISASHNPYTDNGIKFFGPDGFKFEEDVEDNIEKILNKKKYLNEVPKSIGKAFRIEDASGRYIVYLKNTFPKGFNLNGIKLVLDSANGAGYKVSPLVFAELGAETILLSNEPDGKNINLNCGALFPDNLKKKVLETNSDIGIALDGDADRSVFVDNKGNIVDGDKILALCINNLIKNKNTNTKNDIFVFTEMSNIALQKFVKSMNANFILTGVGDKHVVKEMRGSNCKFGGEKSGHYIFMDHSTTGDGTLSALQILSIMKKTGESLYDLSNIIDLYPQLLVNIKVKEKAPFESIPDLNESLNRCNSKLGDSGRINLRYSGTEKLARVMVEGDNKKVINDIATEISNIIEKHIGVQI
jgi:phosphoglucosamine mutase